MKNCTLLVSSCDKYEDLWNPFFKLLKLNWKEFDMPIVLNTETKTYMYEGLDIATYSLYKNNNISWGKRLIDHLNRIDTEFVLFMLDDFFIRNKVNNDKFEKCLEWIAHDDKVAAFYFSPFNRNCINDGRYEGFVKKKKNSNYRVNCQCALWNKKHLLSLIRPHESPWNFEIYGTKRSNRTNLDFYVAKLVNNNDELIIDYDYKNMGAICKGKWTKNAVQLLNDYNVNIDFECRGIINSDFLERENIIKYTMHNLNVKKIISAIIVRYKSLK